MNVILTEIWNVAKRLDREILDTKTVATIAAFLEDFDIKVSDDILQEHFMAFEQDFLNQEAIADPSYDPRDLLVTEFMTANVRTVGTDLPLTRLCARLARQMVSGFPVVDHRGCLVGVISSTDVVRAVAEQLPLDELTVGDLMTRYVITANRQSNIMEVLHLMLNFRLHRAVVVDEENKPIGVVTTYDAAVALKKVLSEHRDCPQWDRRLLFAS